MANRENSHSPWSEADDTRLAELALLPIQKQAGIMGRTPAGIVGRRAKLRKKVSMRVDQPDGTTERWRALPDQVKKGLIESFKCPYFTVELISRLSTVEVTTLNSWLVYLGMVNTYVSRDQFVISGATTKSMEDAFFYYTGCIVDVDPVYREVNKKEIFHLPEAYRDSFQILTDKAHAANKPLPAYCMVYNPHLQESFLQLSTDGDDMLAGFITAQVVPLTNVRITSDTPTTTKNKPKKKKRTKRKNRR